MTDGGVSLSVDGHADRDQLASQVAARIRIGDMVWPLDVADIVLASDWLRERDRAVRKAEVLWFMQQPAPMPEDFAERHSEDGWTCNVDKSYCGDQLSDACSCCQEQVLEARWSEQ